MDVFRMLAQPCLKSDKGVVKHTTNVYRNSTLSAALLKTLAELTVQRI